VFQEGERGSIAPGKLADFAILTLNPVAQPEMLNQTRVAQTIRRGSCVYRAN
jgi:predicted amidohydrolase YtcJ